jgi:acetyl-CoA acetyltransferase
MPWTTLPVPTAGAAEASALIRQVRTGAIEHFIDGALTAAPGLSDEQLAVLIGYAGDYAAMIVDACCSPGIGAVLRDLAATGIEADAGRDGAA